jgi:hypothetical protein
MSDLASSLKRGPPVSNIETDSKFFWRHHNSFSNRSSIIKKKHNYSKFIKKSRLWNKIFKDLVY